MEKSNRFKVEMELTTLEQELLSPDVVRDIVINNLKHNFSDGSVKDVEPLKPIKEEDN